MSKLFLRSASLGLVEHFHRKSHVLFSLFWMIVRRVRRMRHGRFHASRLRQFSPPVGAQ